MYRTPCPIKGVLRSISREQQVVSEPKRRNDVKARTTLLLAFPDEHQLRFSKYKTTQELWAAILNTFGRNKATKKTKKNQLKQQYGNFKAEGKETLEQTFNRLQAIVSHLEFMDVEIELDDLNQKFLTSLAPEWLMYTIVWRNKSDLDTMSLDDLYNHLKVYELEVQKKSESNSQNMAFISSAKNSSGKEEVNTASFPTTITQTRKKITIQGTDVVGFDKSKVECFNCHKMGHFARECRAPKSQDRGRRENFKQGSKTEEQAPKALMAIDGVRWDWSYMANEKEDHALVADQEAPTEFALMAKSSSDNEIFDNSLYSKACKKNTDSLNTKITKLNKKLSDTKTTLYHYKLSLSKVEARLVEFKNQEIKFCEKIRGLEFNVECKNNRIERLTNELEELKKEKEGLDGKLTVYSPPKRDMSWTGLPEFANDTITDYSRPSPSIESNSNDLQSSNSSVSENGESSSSILSKPVITFVKAADSPTVIKMNKDETVRKSSINMLKCIEKLQRVLMLGDSGCSRHMIGNISYLSDYEPYDGGYVLFGQGGGKITSKGFIKNRDFKLKDDTNVLLRTPRQHNMYFIDLNNILPHKDLTCLVAKASADESILWHRRLGNLNFKTMNKLVRHNLVRGFPSKCFENDHTCVACLKEKQHKAFCKTKLVNLVSKPLHTLHMDLFGPTSVSSLNHKWYCLVVIDDFSRFTWTFFLKTKDEISGILRNFIIEIENIKGVLRVLVNKSQNKTPYELFNGRTPSIGFLKPFGCHVMILNTLDNLGKFDAKGDEGYFIGYSMSSKTFRVFNKRTKRVKENLHVDFLKNKLIEKGARPNWLFDIDTLTNSMNYVPVVVTGTSSTNFSGTKDATSQDVKKDLSSSRYIALPNWFHEAHLESSTMESAIPTVSSPFLTACLDDSLKPSSNTRLISKRVTSQDDTPSLYNILNLSNRFGDILGVTTNTDDTHGVEVDLGNMENNISASPTPTFRIHKDHPKSQIIGPVDTPVQTKTKSKENVWILVDCPEGVRPIGTKWVLKNKKDERGIVIRNKARLVAQGHTQEEEIDYEEVFAPVTWIEAIRLLLAYASFMGFTVYQMDVKSAFLYGTIDEEVYVMQPPRFQDLKFPARVYKVEKAMYGLHQAPKALHKGDFILVQVYVDDIIFGSSNPQLCREFEALMHEKFQMSAMGKLNFFLGLQVLQKKDGIFLSQDKYVGGDILKKFRYSDVRSANNPMDKENPWGKDKTDKDVDLHLYRSIIGSLMYLTASRPDIIDYGGATQDQKLTTGGCQFLGGRLISWQCKKQTIMATSTTEAEYVAAASDCGQVLWIQNQLLDYGPGALGRWLRTLADD
nr:hypothetical protein [Tanacetum cinerariifolium]